MSIPNMHRSILQDQHRTLLYQSMNYGSQPNTATRIQKIQIKDIQQKSDHITYRILTMFLSGNKKTKHVNTTRRYSDFERLHLYFKNVVGKAKMIILPKLPNKHGIQDYLQFWEDSKAEFFNERKQDLEIYLRLLVECEGVRDDPILKQFLEEGSVDKLEEEIAKANLKIPTSAPEKAYYVIKKTFVRVRGLFEGFNTPTVEVQQSLKNKIQKIQKIKSTMVELITLELERAKCLKIKQKQLCALKNTQTGGLLKGIAQTLKQKILSSVSYQQPENSNCLPCIEKLYNYIEAKFKDEKNYCDKIEEMKKQIKTMISRCDSVLELFEEIVGEKEEQEKVIKKLIELEMKIEEDKYVKEGLRVLNSYEGYYKMINKIGEAKGNNRLSQVNQEEDEGF